MHAHTAWKTKKILLNVYHDLGYVLGIYTHLMTRQIISHK